MAMSRKNRKVGNNCNGPDFVQAFMMDIVGKPVL